MVSQPGDHIQNSTVATFLDFIHRLFLKSEHHFGSLLCFHPQVELNTLLGQIEGTNPDA